MDVARPAPLHVASHFVVLDSDNAQRFVPAADAVAFVGIAWVEH